MFDLENFICKYFFLLPGFRIFNRLWDLKKLPKEGKSCQSLSNYGTLINSYRKEEFELILRVGIYNSGTGVLSKQKAFLL